MALSLVLLVACADDPEKPPALSCDGPCIGRPSGAVRPGTPTDAGAGGGGNGDAAFDDAGLPDEVTLTGSVVEFSDDTFSRVQAYSGRARVSALASDGGRVAANFEGDVFELFGVLPTPVNWIAAEPLGDFEALSTYHVVDSTQNRELVLGLVPQSTLELIYGILSTPVALEPGTAHAVLFFTDSQTKEPVSGVGVSLPLAEVIAFGSADSWSDIDVATGPPGSVILGNVPAPPFPGIEYSVELSGAHTGSVGIQMAADTVTIADIAL